MKYRELEKILIKDLIRYNEKSNITIIDIIKGYFQYIGFKITLIMRLCKYVEKKKILKPVYYFLRIVYRRLQVKYGIQISHKLSIDGGFKISHYGTIVIAGKSIIGKNFDIRQGTTIGVTDKGSPIIGDNVFVGANSCIIGKIKIGNNVVIGAGSVVVKDVPNNCTVAGNPAKIIKSNNRIENV